MPTTILSDDFDYILSIQYSTSSPSFLASATQSPIYTYVSTKLPSSIVSFFHLPTSDAQSTGSVSSALSAIGIKVDDGDTPYTHIRLHKALGRTYLKEDNGLTTNPPFLISVAISPTSESEADFNAWYAEEHLDLLSRVPGWEACRRFSLVDAKSNVTNVSPPRYRALHAYQHLEGFNTEEYKAATSTPWRTRVMQSVVASERNVYRLQ
ncbi:hypothetical protein C8R42DRAFT_649902 [Lentinula raphanica]|nr:hypothetical protein C8R42DRAFT_649902 [Lentinula raphanica]